MKSKKLTKKQWISMIFFILIIVIVIPIAYKDYSRTGCIFGIQKAEPSVSTEGGVFKISGYKCSWNSYVISLIIGLALITMGGVISKQRR